MDDAVPAGDGLRDERQDAKSAKEEANGPSAGAERLMRGNYRKIFDRRIARKGNTPLSAWRLSLAFLAPWRSNFSLAV
jgi:hypothetical protein